MFALVVVFRFVQILIMCICWRCNWGDGKMEDTVFCEGVIEKVRVRSYKEIELTFAEDGLLRYEVDRCKSA